MSQNAAGFLWTRNLFDNYLQIELKSKLWSDRPSLEIHSKPKVKLKFTSRLTAVVSLANQIIWTILKGIAIGLFLTENRCIRWHHFSSCVKYSLVENISWMCGKLILYHKTNKRSLGCALFCCKALRKRQSTQAVMRTHTTTSHVSPHALQQNRIQSKLLYLLTATWRL